MSKRGKVFVLVSVFVPVLFVSAMVTNWFVYPFTSAKPNFADVETVYNKMVVPETWVKKGEGANKGIAGRQCPIESDGCFSQYREYNLPSDSTKSTVENVVLSSGCISALERNEAQRGDPREVFTYTCMSGGIRVIGSWEKVDNTISGRLTVKSR